MQKQPLLFFKNFTSTIIIKISPFHKSKLLFQKSSLILGMVPVISTFRRMKQEDWNVQVSLDYRVIFCFTKTNKNTQPFPFCITCILYYMDSTGEKKRQGNPSHILLDYTNPLKRQIDRLLRFQADEYEIAYKAYFAVNLIFKYHTWIKKYMII